MMRRAGAHSRWFITLESIRRRGSYKAAVIFSCRCTRLLYRRRWIDGGSDLLGQHGDEAPGLKAH